MRCYFKAHDLNLLTNPASHLVVKQVIEVENRSYWKTLSCN